MRRRFEPAKAALIAFLLTVIATGSAWAETGAGEVRFWVFFNGEDVTADSTVFFATLDGQPVGVGSKLEEGLVVVPSGDYWVTVEYNAGVSPPVPPFGIELSVHSEQRTYVRIVLNASDPETGECVKDPGG